MKIIKLYFIFFLQIFFLEKFFSRTFFTPFPGIKEEHLYYINEKDSYFSTSAKFFTRKINGAFGYEDILENLSTIYHGASSFDLADLFYDSQVEKITINGEEIYIDGFVQPDHKISNFGTTLELDYFKKFKDFNLILHSRLPIQFINVEQKEGYNAIKFFKNLYFNENEINKVSVNILRDVISGKFKEGYEINWNNFKNFGVGNFDFEINLQKLVLNEKLLLNFITGIVLPTDQEINFKELNNYLATSFGNNKHYEFRIGGQGIFKIFNFLDFLFYGTYNNIFSKKENFIATFKGANAFNLQPTFVDANLKWNEFIFITDLIFKPSESLKFLFGYTFFKKNKDFIFNYNKFNKDAIENIKETNFNQLSNFSERKAHKIKGLISFLYKEKFNFDIFASGILTGEDVPRELDFGFSIGLFY